MPDEDLRECGNCGEPVAFLSSRDWCDGCEEEADAAPTGTWRKISCTERDELKASRDLKPFASRTDLGGEFGDPEIFTEWGDPTTDTPVLRDHRYPPLYTGLDTDPTAYAQRPDTRPCEHYRYEEEAL